MHTKSANRVFASVYVCLLHSVLFRQCKFVYLWIAYAHTRSSCKFSLMNLFSHFSICIVERLPHYFVLFDLNIAFKGRTWNARGSNRKTIICNRLMAPQLRITSTMPFDLNYSEPHFSQIVDHRRIRLIRVHLLHIDRLVAPVPWNPLIGHFLLRCQFSRKSKMQPQTFFRLVLLIISNRGANRIATHHKKKTKTIIKSAQ